MCKSLTLTLTLVSTLFTFTASAEKNKSIIIDKSSTALVITDPQNDFLDKSGVAYELVKSNLEKVGTIHHIEQLFHTAKSNNIPVFVSPHYYLPHDQQWKERGALQKTIADIKMFSIPASANNDVSGTGADFLAQYKKYILDGKTTITSPHKVYGPDSNDLVLQLRKQGIQTVILGGMAANLCTDSHMRELKEQGFNVIVVKDAVGAPGEAAYNAALTNYSMIANDVVSTNIAISLLK